MTRSLVSCLMPTADRRRYVPGAIASFLAQDYEPRELIVLDDGQDSVGDLIPADGRVRYVRTPNGKSLGEKRNEACRLARGEILVHWDDDDWSAPWRISYQVQQLHDQRADVCGLDRLWFYDSDQDAAWWYRYAGRRLPWLAGSSMCFRRQFWERWPFPDLSEGEDTLWIAGAVGARVLPLARVDFLIARVHAGNTSPKQTDGTWWLRGDPGRVREILGPDLLRFCAPLAAPLVSCILPTGGRRPFCALALEAFLAQDYPDKEIIVVDEGRDTVEDLVAAIPEATYLWLPERRSLAAKRNLACAAALGDVFVQWDDDDWFGPSRLSRQVEPILERRAEVTALDTRWIATLPAGEFWSVSPELHRRMFYLDVHGGTLAFSRSVWAAGARYPEDTWPEDAGFLYDALSRGNRLLRVPNDELFVYVRHDRNAWSFPVGSHVDPGGWRRTHAPRAFGPTLLSRYRRAAREQQLV